MRWAWRTSTETGCDLDVVTSDMDRVGGWWAFCLIRISGIADVDGDAWRG
jgi:hypothetical protein